MFSTYSRRFHGRLKRHHVINTSQLSTTEMWLPLSNAYCSNTINSIGSWWNIKMMKCINTAAHMRAHGRNNYRYWYLMLDTDRHHFRWHQQSASDAALSALASAAATASFCLLLGVICYLISTRFEFTTREQTATPTSRLPSVALPRRYRVCSKDCFGSPTLWCWPTYRDTIPPAVPTDWTERLRVHEITLAVNRSDCKNARQPLQQLADNVCRCCEDSFALSSSNLFRGRIFLTVSDLNTTHVVNYVRTHVVSIHRSTERTNERNETNTSPFNAVLSRTSDSSNPIVRL